jgi:hypothetical protein
MSNHTRRPILTATAIAAALTISALGAGAALAQSGEEMPTDEATGALDQMAEVSAADDAAATAGFSLVTDEMGNTQLVRDPDSMGTASDGDVDDYGGDDEFEDENDHDDEFGEDDDHDDFEEDDEDEEDDD